MPYVTSQSLINWEMIQKVGDTLVPINAYMLLIGKRFEFSKIQYATFKGTSRSVFINKKEYSGSLFEQLEAAYFALMSWACCEEVLQEKTKDEIMQYTMLYNEMKQYVMKKSIQIYG